MFFFILPRIDGLPEIFPSFICFCLCIPDERSGNVQLQPMSRVDILDGSCWQLKFVCWVTLWAPKLRNRTFQKKSPTLEALHLAYLVFFLESNFWQITGKTFLSHWIKISLLITREDIVSFLNVFQLNLRHKNSNFQLVSGAGRFRNKSEWFSPTKKIRKTVCSKFEMNAISTIRTHSFVGKLLLSFDGLNNIIFLMSAGEILARYYICL